MKPNSFSSRKPIVLLSAIVLCLSAAVFGQTTAISITSCTPTFNADVPGALYTVANDLTATSGNCIDVTATGVTILLNGATLTGASQGSGIYIVHNAIGVRIVGPGTISGFNLGVDDYGRVALIYDLTLTGNKIGGVRLTAVHGGTVEACPLISGNGSYGVLLKDTLGSMVLDNPQISANGNGTTGYGIWIQNDAPKTVSEWNVVARNGLSNEGQAPLQVVGIWVGYNGTVDDCPTVSAPSSQNLILDNVAVDYSQQIGIGLQCGGASVNTVVGNVADLNGLNDGYDGSTACGSNNWNGDTFGTVNQPCVE